MTLPNMNMGHLYLRPPGQFLWKSPKISRCAPFLGSWEWDFQTKNVKIAWSDWSRYTWTVCWNCNFVLPLMPILLLFMALFFYFWSSVSPSKKKKLQSSTIAVNINVGLLNQEWKKNQGVWYLWQFQAWICQKKRGKQKFLSFTHISQWPPPKKKDKKPNPNSVYKLSEQGEVPQEY